MSSSISLKVYNKDAKLKLTIRDDKAIQVITLYKYNGENEEVHSFVVDSENTIKPYQVYYEMSTSVDGVPKEAVRVSDTQIEHMDGVYKISNTEVVRTTIKLDSGNVYENKVKLFDEERYEIEYLNGEINKFKFKLKENKINEYLEKLDDGK